MIQLFLVLTLLGFLALLKGFSPSQVEPSLVLANWLATIGFISGFGTFLSMIYMLSFKLVCRRKRNPKVNVLQVLKLRELSLPKNSMVPLLAHPREATIPILASSSNNSATDITTDIATKSVTNSFSDKPLNSLTPIDLSPSESLIKLEKSNETLAEISVR